MILIVTESNDPTSDLICNYLIKERMSFFRINSEEIGKIVSLKITNYETEFEYHSINGAFKYSEISAVYFRRGNINLQDNKSIHPKRLEFFLNKEIEKLSDFVHYLLELKPCIGRYEKYGPNKLVVLKKALSCGLKIPNTSIVKTKSHLIKELSDREIITKAIFEPIAFQIGEYSFSNPTVEIKQYDLTLIPQDFHYSLIQDKLNKEFEIRLFYFFGECYSMAILSKNNPKTEIDFRNYDDSKPNRFIPCIISEEVRIKLNSLMLELNYNIGCIDLIYENNQYCFLEINPVGQYGMISEPCQYYLEKIVAEKLITMSKNYG